MTLQVAVSAPQKIGAVPHDARDHNSRGEAAECLLHRG